MSLWFFFFTPGAVASVPGEINLTANISAASSTPTVQAEIPGVSAPDVTNIPMRRRRFYASTTISPTPDIAGIRLRAHIDAVSSTPALATTTNRNLHAFILGFSSAGREFLPDWHRDELAYRNVLTLDFSVATSHDLDMSIETVRAQAFEVAVEQQSDFAIEASSQATFAIAIDAETNLDLMIVATAEMSAAIDHQDAAAISEVATGEFGISTEQSEAFDR